MPKMVIFLVHLDESVSSNHRENKTRIRRFAQKPGLIPPFWNCLTIILDKTLSSEMR